MPPRTAHRLAAPLIGLAVGVVVVGLRAPGWLAAVEFEAYDAFMRLRPDDAGPDPRIVVVRVGEEDIRRYGHPLPDSILAAAIRELLAAGPAAVGVDIYRDQEVGEGHAQLREVIRGDGRVVLIEKVGDASHSGVPAPLYLDPSQVGFSDFVTDDDGITRRALLYLWDDAGAHVSLSLQLARRYLEGRGIAVSPDPEDPEMVRVGGTPVPYFRSNDGPYRGADDRGYQFLLDFRGAPAPFSSQSFSRLVDGDAGAEALGGRVVLVGTVAASVSDRFASPFHAPGQQGRAITGVELHAHSVSQLLRAGLDGATPIRTLSEPTEALWILGWSLAGALCGLRLRRPLSLVSVALGGLALLVAVCFGAFVAGWWIPLVPSGLATLAAAFVTVTYAVREEHAERDLVMELFARNVGQSVADELWEQRDQFMEGGRPRAQRLLLTVLMADLKGYTGVSEQMDPIVLMDWVNEFMSAMAQLIEEHGGTVDDYAGDGIKANFGAPVPRRDEAEIAEDANHAVACALAMAYAMDRLNASWGELGLPTARMRVGIHTGPAVVGSLGSERRLKFTSIGDTVNTAARLESFDKDGFDRDPLRRSCRILISDTTLRHVAGQVETEAVGEHELPGRSGRVGIFRISGRAVTGDSEA